MTLRRIMRPGDTNIRIHRSTRMKRVALPALNQDAIERYLVSHSAPVYLIDPEGRNACPINAAA